MGWLRLASGQLSLSYEARAAAGNAAVRVSLGSNVGMICPDQATVGLRMTAEQGDAQHSTSITYENGDVTMSLQRTCRTPSRVWSSTRGATVLQP